ncbi:MAG TPA: elongation factor Ts [Candidatus Dojkabacteria bacterium]|nr:elongation factor Ts [Candidatus Dojkabacteria bacterium]
MAVALEEIKRLRDATGVGINTCKDILERTNGNYEKAMEEIRKQGLIKFESRAGKKSSNGVIGVYEHGVDHTLVALVEVGCETDFVAQNEIFREFAHDVAMQVAAMKPLYISREDVPKDQLEKEASIWRDEFKKQGKPENVIESVLKGKIESYYKEVCLLEQVFFKEDAKTIQDMLSEILAKFGERILIKRFLIWQVGESA